MLIEDLWAEKHPKSFKVIYTLHLDVANICHIYYDILGPNTGNVNIDGLYLRVLGAISNTTTESCRENKSHGFKDPVKEFGEIILRYVCRYIVPAIYNNIRDDDFLKFAIPFYKECKEDEREHIFMEYLPEYQRTLVQLNLLNI